MIVMEVTMFKSS